MTRRHRGDGPGTGLLPGRAASIAVEASPGPAPDARGLARVGVSELRPFLRAFVSAVRDPATYRVRRNPGLWLGFVLALPIPALVFLSSSPTWIAAVSAAAPFAWAALLGAAARVAGRGEDRIQQVTSDAAAAHAHSAEENDVLRLAVASERAGRERQETIGRRMDEELLLAQNVHRSLLPDDIVRPDVCVVARLVPCEFVGGDYMQALLPGDDLLYLCIGDVSGHGVSAALVVSRIHETVRQLVLDRRSPADIVDELSRATTRILVHTSLFLTFAVFRVSLSAGRIDYATAGHPPQVLLRRDGRREELVTRNPLLGCGLVGTRGAAVSRSTDYAHGDTLVLFTDGVFEVLARNGNERLGEEGLLAMMQGLEPLAPAEFAATLLDRVSSFGRPGSFEDDACLMVARLGGDGDAVRAL